MSVDLAILNAVLVIAPLLAVGLTLELRDKHRMRVERGKLREQALHFQEQARGLARENEALRARLAEMTTEYEGKRDELHRTRLEFQNFMCYDGTGEGQNDVR